MFGLWGGGGVVGNLIGQGWLIVRRKMLFRMKSVGKDWCRKH